MCGIFAVFGRPLHDADIKAAIDGLRHRGPDWQEFLREDGGVLGHTRLSIIDLDERANQPMQSGNERYAIVFNGEIYNYRDLKVELESAGHTFATESDTEVILEGFAEWGTDVFRRLRGMFALSIWDRRESTLTLARDPLGIKPLYVGEENGGIGVASEIRTIRRLGFGGGGIDPAGLAGYLGFGSVPEPRTMLAGVSVLPAGNFAVWKGGNLTTTRYWALDFSQQIPYADRAEAAADLRETLIDSMRAHLIADVPVGCFLSGGIDSSALVGLAAHVMDRPLKTFSIGFAGQEAFDETAHALTVAERFGADHTRVEISEDGLRHDLPDYFSDIDHPSFDGLNTWTVSRAVHEQGMKVALSGVGGDELFAGYPGFKAYPPISRALSWLPNSALRMAGRGLRLKALRRYPLALELMGQGRGVLGILEASRMFIAPWDIQELAPGLPPVMALDDPDYGARHDVDRYSAHELTHYMRHTLLRDSDQFSMAHSLEIRTPFVDQVLVEKVAAISGNLKVSDPPKALLREALPEPLPDSIVNRQKMGFTFPLSTWMKGPLADEIGEAFENSVLVRMGLLDGAAVNRYWQRFLSGTEKHEVSWQLYVLENWCRKMGFE